MQNNERLFMLEYARSIYGDKRVSTNMTIPQSVFKQFFTPQRYSNIMLDSLDISPPKKIIDLAMGEASLLLESMKHWTKAKYFGNDIDKKCYHKINSEHNNIKCFNLNIFEKNTIKQIKNDIGEVDLCVGNPPFHLITSNKDIKNILKEYSLDKEYKTEKIPAEIIFILQCLSILSESGTLSLILPDGFFVNKYLAKFRKFIIDNYEIISIKELPKNIFQKTDAKTHILNLKKIKPLNKTVKLTKYGEIENLYIKKTDAIKRMDYKYYKNLKKFSKYKPICNFDILFMRGKPKYLIENIKKEHILHTTNFSKGTIFKNRLSVKTKLLEKYKDKMAIAGDIIIARVGSACIGKIGYVEKGAFVATDCVFILRISDPILRNNIYNMLISKKGQSWINSYSKGVSARHITLEDIKKFPFFERDN